MFTYSHANTPLGQSERMYYLSYFINYASNIHYYNTRYTAKKNLYNISIQTNICKQSISFTAKDIWKDLPTHLKNSSMSEFPKKFIIMLSTTVLSGHQMK